MFRTLVGAATALLLSAGVLTAQNFPERELLGVIMWAPAERLTSSRAV